MPDVELFRKEWGDGYDAHSKGWRPANEFDWFAADSKGQIACFMTAGFAVVPTLVFRDKEKLWRIYNYFYKEPEDYAYVRKVSSLMEYDVNYYAAQGLYSYDNPSDAEKPYQLIRSSKMPVHISALPAEIREWLEPLTFREFVFGETSIVEVSKYFESI